MRKDREILDRIQKIRTMHIFRLMGRNNLSNRKIEDISFHSFCTAFAQFDLPLPVCFNISFSVIFFVFIIDYFVNGTSINKKQIVLNEN
jgi:hypothetical protein